MAEILKPDLCVIGAGSGGLTVAAAAAAFGVPTVLIERNKMGGECLNTGCVPSKALLAVAKRAELMRKSEIFGVSASEVAVDFAKVRAHVRKVIEAIAPADSAERFTGLGVRVIKGEAKFADRRTIAVGEEYQIRARRFVIATGSSPAVPSLAGLDTGPYLTNETVFQLIECPKHLIVIGAGPTGLELAQAFRRLGCDVTVLEAAQPLPHDDPETARIVLDQLEREGIVLRSGVNIARVSHQDGVTVTIDGGDGEEFVSGSHLLIAAGRKPTVEGLSLEVAGVKYDRVGIVVDRKLKTANRRVYAIGDVVAGQPRFTHAAAYHAGLVIRNALFRLRVRIDADVVPWVTYTDPELAQAGLTEAAARARGFKKLRILRWPYHDNDRAQTERTTLGHIKVITDKRGTILGASIVGAHAGELIALWAFAIARGTNIRALAGLVLPYPTLSEVGKRAAIDFFTPDLTRPMLRRILAWLRIFG